MIGIAPGCKRQATCERWLTERGFRYCVVESEDLALQVDVIIFCGGPDLGIEPERDESDERLVRFCLEKNVSMLGICRGMQEIAFFMGSDLIEDLGDKNAVHKTVEDKSRFHDIVLSDGRRWHVNSRHHQAVANLPFECGLSAKSEDGVWELFMAYARNILLVQSHPEMEEMRGSDIETFCVAFLREQEH